LDQGSSIAWPLKHNRWVLGYEILGQAEKIMKRTKQEIINEINKSFSFLCWPYWMDRKGRIHDSGSKLQAPSSKQQAVDKLGIL